ncbi:MAG: 2-hydroxychromene-2-carboxylate isomerase [Parasphingorhabdus sp.]|jgi:2-hydroxychromene-2-carboxylate isomerase
MQKQVDYYLFLTSPWSYLASRRARKIFQRHDVEVSYKPIDAMETFAIMGGIPVPKRHPSRLKWRLEELKRWSDFLDVPINLQPAFFPADQSLAAKMLLVLDQHEQAGDFADAVLSAVWRDEQNIADEATLKNLATNCGLDASDLIAQARTKDMGEKYQSTTLEAHEKNVFGSPSYIYNSELFWGQDRLDFLDRALAK